MFGRKCTQARYMYQCPYSSVVLHKRKHRRPRFLLKLFILVECISVVFLLEIIAYYDNSNCPPVFSQPPYSEDKTLITMEVRVTRRLGNLMFNYAALLGIASRNHMDRVLPSSFNPKNIFHISGMFAEDIDSVMGIHRTYEERHRRACAYDPGTENLVHFHTRLLGYYQSWLYFQNVSEQLRREFTFRKEVLDIAEQFHDSIHIQEWNCRELGSKWQKYIKVGIHVRRGDFLLTKSQKFGYTVADPGYFTRAMTYFTKRHGRVQFVVCSDDIPWAKENIVLPKNSDSKVAFSRGHADFEDLAILALCDHTIMSVGSFGWWAGWLAGGTTLYYKDWPKEHSLLSYQFDKTTYFPPEWIALS